MKYKNGREVQLHDNYVHVDADNKRVPNKMNGHVGGTSMKDGSIQMNANEQYLSECLHLQDFRELEKQAKEQSEKKA